MGKLCTVGDWSWRTTTALRVHYELLSSVAVHRKMNPKADSLLLTPMWKQRDSGMFWSHISARLVMAEENKASVLCNWTCYLKLKWRLLMCKLVLFSVFPDTGHKNTSTSTAAGLALHVVFRKEADGRERKPPAMGRINHGKIQTGQILKSLIRQDRWGSHLAGFKPWQHRCRVQSRPELDTPSGRKVTQPDNIISRNPR